jgi:hypothetical protein
MVTMAATTPPTLDPKSSEESSALRRRLGASGATEQLPRSVIGSLVR